MLVHGLLDTPAVFRGLIRELGGGRQPLLIPDLPLRLGRTSIPEAAALLGSHIEAAFGTQDPLDLLGFSMGGVIARSWIQLLRDRAALAPLARELLRPRDCPAVVTSQDP